MGLQGFTHRSSEKLLQNSGFSIGRTPFFFHQKCFPEHSGILEGKNIEKKHFPKKWMDLHGFTQCLFRDTLYRLHQCISCIIFMHHERTAEKRNICHINALQNRRTC
jgi:hypothetical protein